MRQVFGETLVALADEFPDMVVLDADCASSTQTRQFATAYPERFFNMGIAEANMVAAAAGLSATGLIPVASTFAFLLSLRAGDQVRSLLAYNSLNVKLAGGYAGLSDFADGASHQSIMDLAVMTALPNMTVLVPSDITETRLATRAMLEHKGPVYLRLSRAEVEKRFDEDHPFVIGQGVQIQDGSDVTLIACGVASGIAQQAADELVAQGLRVRLIDMHTIKPLDVELVQRAAEQTGAIVTVEEHNIIGGLGAAVASAVCHTHPVPVIRVGLEDRFGESGPYADILARAGLSREQVVTAAQRAIAMKHTDR
ncbi:MAG: hypothetical protein IT445_14680 [Phycisphaeraceae bacterium]|nr:hypothetical protein [Phycisphaeraceae bacterium]